MKTKAKKLEGLTAKENKMLKEYAQACEAKSPIALKAWARKHKAKLTGTHSMEFARSCIGAETALAPEEKDCEKVCPEAVNTQLKLKFGRLLVGIACDLVDCSYDRSERRWTCDYKCSVVVVKNPDYYNA